MVSEEFIDTEIKVYAFLKSSFSDAVWLDSLSLCADYWLEDMVFEEL